MHEMGGRGCCVALWLAIEWLWSALAGPFLTLLAQTGIETTPLTLYGHHFWYHRPAYWSESPDH